MSNTICWVILSHGKTGKPKVILYLGVDTKFLSMLSTFITQLV